jgi:hypothetical protein
MSICLCAAGAVVKKMRNVIASGYGDRTMTYGKKSEMLYRMIKVKVWVDYLGIQTQATRELNIQIAKLSRLCSVDVMDFLDRFDSVKRAMKMKASNDKRINSQYQSVLSHVERVFQDVAAHKGEGHLTRARLRERVYGTNGFVREVEDYARQHSVK